MYGMLNKINQTLNAIQTDVQQLKSSKMEINEQIDGIQYEQEEVFQKVAKQTKDMRVVQDKVDLISNIAAKYETQIQMLLYQRELPI